MMYDGQTLTYSLTATEFHGHRMTNMKHETMTDHSLTILIDSMMHSTFRTI